MSISELMAAGDPMLSPVAPEQEMGPPPPMNTSPTQNVPQHHQLQEMMNSNDVKPPKPMKRASDALNADVKDAIVVAFVAFAVLLPNVQSLLASKLSMMQTQTSATLFNAIIIALAFYFMKEHVLDML